MHAFFTPFGVYPNNAIVGGSGDIAVGAALFKKVNRKPGIVVANIGDASMACGPVWEGLAFATMDQFNELWEGDMKGGLPLIINIMNNQYGMGGQTCGETMGYNIAARIGAGLNADQLHAERVDGYNPLAVIDAYKRKRTILEEKTRSGFIGRANLPLQRSLTVGCVVVPLERRGGSLGGTRFDCLVWRRTGESRCCNRRSVVWN